MNTLDRYDWRKARKELERKQAEHKARRITFHLKGERARKKGAKPSLSFKEWESILDRYFRRCANCKVKHNPPYLSLTVDHAVPLSKGGRHHKDNIQPLCRKCNFAKADTAIKWVIPHYEEAEQEVKIRVNLSRWENFKRWISGFAMSLLA